MTFEEARAKFVLVSHFGGRPEWPAGYRDGDNGEYVGTVGGVGVFVVSLHEGSRVDLWSGKDNGMPHHSRLTLAEGAALSGLLAGRLVR